MARTAGGPNYTPPAAAGGGGSTIVVKDEGTTVDAAADTVDFVGAGVTATQTAAGKVQVSIPGGGGGVSDTPFGPSWNGDTTTAASKNAIYDEVAAHEAATTSVHGIADTSALYRAGGTDVAVADGGTGSSTAAGARTNLQVEGLTTKADVNHTATTSDKYIAYTSLTATRTVTLPDASTFPDGYQLWIADASGSASPTVSIVISPAAGDDISGNVAWLLNTPYHEATLTKVSANRWVVDDGHLARFHNLDDILNPATARTNLGLAIGTNVEAWNALLDAIAALAANGLIARTGSGSAAARTITAGSAKVTVANGSGAAGNPTVDLGSVASTDLSDSSGLARKTDNLSVFASTTSAQLAGVLSDETGTGAVVFATSPTLVTPNLGTPSAATLTNATGLPISTGVSGLAAGIATFLATPTSANLAAAVTDETGTGALVFGTSPTIVTPTIASHVNAQHDHSNAAGGGNIPESSVTNLVTDLAAKWQRLVPTAVKTTGYTAAAYDLVPVDTTSGDVTITLPSAPAAGTTIAVTHITRGSPDKFVTIARGGTDVFTKSGGPTSIALVAERDSAVLFYTSGVWHVLDRRTGIDVQVYTANGTWRKPLNATTVAVIAIGGGGSGGAGRRDSAAAARWGGSGGAGAGVTRVQLDASLLASTETVTIGQGGAASSGRGTNGDGAAGNAGTDSSFGTWAVGGGGPGGGGGTSTGSSSGGQTHKTTEVVITAPGAFNSGPYGAAGDGGRGGDGTAFATLATGAAWFVSYLPGKVPFLPGSGGGGGGITSGGTVQGGSRGGDGHFNLAAGGAEGTGGANGSAGANSTVSGPGGGGGGGGASSAGTAGSGGAGGTYGGAGGGGGASATGTSGGGGAGANGLVVVFTWR